MDVFVLSVLFRVIECSCFCAVGTEVCSGGICADDADGVQVDGWTECCESNKQNDRLIVKCAIFSD